MKEQDNKYKKQGDFKQKKKMATFIKKALNEIKPYKAPEKPIPNFLENFRKKKEKERLEQGKLLSPKKLKENLKEKSTKRKQNLDYAKKINTELNKITLVGQPMGFPIELFPDENDNLSACIFYAFNTKFAAFVKGTDGIYQAKNTPYVEVSLKGNQSCVLNHFKSKPDMIVYNSLTNMMGQTTTGFTHGVSNKILNTFGLHYESPSV